MGGATFRVVANIAMSYVGAGVLGLPYAFKEAGNVTGCLILATVGAFTVLAMSLLIDTKYYILRRAEADQTSSLEERSSQGGSGTSSANATHGDVAHAAYGHKGRAVMDFALMLSQLGLASAYYFFISDNLAVIVTRTSKEFWIAVFTLPFFVMTLEKDLNKFAKYSVLSQMANALAFGVILWYEFLNFGNAKQFRQNQRAFEETSNSGSSFILMFSLSIYSFEGAGLILSLENSMPEAEKSKFKKLFAYTIGSITSFYIIFGVMGYLVFGQVTQELITDNLSRQGQLNLSLLVKVNLCFSLYFSYPLMLIPVSTLIEQRLSSQEQQRYRILIRLVLVLVTAMVIMLFPQFVSLLEMVGATCCSTVAFILPALCHLKLFGNELTPAQRLLDWSVLTIGGLALTLGLLDMVAPFEGFRSDFFGTNEEEILSSP